MITAADIQADADIEIMNPDQVIATLSGGADSKFYMELTITKGRGYVSADKNKNADLPIGVIAVESILQLSVLIWLLPTPVLDSRQTMTS